MYKLFLSFRTENFHWNCQALKYKPTQIIQTLNIEKDENDRALSTNGRKIECTD